MRLVLSIVIVFSFSVAGVYAAQPYSTSHASVKANGHVNKKRYLDSNTSKKKLKTKMRLVHGDACPTFKGYHSKPKEKRSKKVRRIHKKRRL